MSGIRDTRTADHATGEKFNLSAALGEIVKNAINQAIEIQQTREQKTGASKMTGMLSVEWGDSFIIRSDNPADPLEKINLVACDCKKTQDEKSTSINLGREIFDRCFILPNFDELRMALGGQHPMEYILMDLLRKRINARFEKPPCDPDRLPYYDEKKTEVVYPLIDGTEARVKEFVEKIGKLPYDAFKTQIEIVDLFRRIKKLAKEIREQEQKMPGAQLASASERGELSQVRRLLNDAKFALRPMRMMDLAELVVWAKAMRSIDPETNKLLNKLLEYELHATDPLDLGLAETMSDMIERIESTTPGHKAERQIQVRDVMTGIIGALTAEYRILLARIRYASVFEEFRSELAADIIGLLSVVNKSLVGRISANAISIAGAQSDYVFTRGLPGPTIFHVLSRLGDLEIFDSMLEHVKKLNIDLNAIGPVPNAFVWMFVKESPILQLPVSEKEKFIRRLVYAGVEPPIDIATMVPANEAELITREYLHRLMVYQRIVMQHVPVEPVAGTVLGYLFGDETISKARGVRVIEEPNLAEAPHALFHTKESKSITPQEAKLNSLFKEMQDIAVMGDDSPLFFATTQWLLQVREIVEALNKSSRSELPVMDDEKHKQHRSDLREFKDQVVAANELMIKLQTKNATGKVVMPEVKDMLSALAEAKGCPEIIKTQFDDLINKLQYRAKLR
ncbi:MAG: hypothetical protein ACYCQI_11220 [Gammaproteobacteria bacterium]